jgi:hypothetical protein
MGDRRDAEPAGREDARERPTPGTRGEGGVERRTPGTGGEGGVERRRPGTGGEGVPEPAVPEAAGEAPAGTAEASLLLPGLPQLTRVLGAVLGSTTVFTAVLFYFGYSKAYYFYAYWGVDSSLLGLTTQDYLQISVDGLYVPMTLIASAGLIVLWVRALVPVRFTPRTVSRIVVPVFAVCGLLLALNGFSRYLVLTVFNRGLAVAPLCLAAGVLLLVYAARLKRAFSSGGSGSGPPSWVPVLEWAVVLMLVGQCLFWAANDYSAATGRSRARQLVAELPRTPRATVYSAKSLSMNTPGVREVRCEDSEAAYRFRYDGLKLVVRSGDQYLFLPERWSRTNGVAFLIPKSATIRLEFVLPSVPGTGRRPAC